MKKTIEKTTSNGIKIEITVSCESGSTQIDVVAHAPEFGYSNGLKRNRAFFRNAPDFVVAMVGPKVGLTVDDLARVDAAIAEIKASADYQAVVSTRQAKIEAEAPVRAKKEKEMEDYYNSLGKIEKAMNL